MTDQKVIKREETDPAYTWAVEDLYKKELLKLIDKY